MTALLQKWTPCLKGGIDVFPGTRVPAQNLETYLAGGFTVEEFMEDFPAVSREMIEAHIKGRSIEAAAP